MRSLNMKKDQDEQQQKPRGKIVLNHLPSNPIYKQDNMKDLQDEEYKKRFKGHLDFFNQKKQELAAQIAAFNEKIGNPNGKANNQIGANIQAKPGVQPVPGKLNPA